MCLPEGVGGSGNPSRFTALVGWLATKAGWKFLQERVGKPNPISALDGATIAIQGVGNVGFNLIDILTEGEPRIKKILIADNVHAQIENVQKLLQRKGKADLLEIRGAEDPLANGNKSTPEEVAAIKARLQSPENEETYILYSQCDVLVPAAVGNVIYEQNVDFLNCKVIVPIANNAYSDNDSIGGKIWERNIVDVVEGNVNWGGATVAASELYGYDEDHVIRWCEEKVYSETLQLLKASQTENVPPWEIKKREAEERFKEPHPTVKVAREGKFIVDISKEFNEWIKEKWLRNATSVGPDKFAKHVSQITQSYLNSDVT
jgi:glutamate dehydrogenase/leucine dehydrogenase